jgi:hypothetical protein
MALISYWLLFVALPSVALFLLLGPSGKSVGIAFGVFIALVVVGERGFRGWAKLWASR